MATTITATPSPNAGSVLLEVATTEADSPQVILDLVYDDIEAETVADSHAIWGGSWTGLIEMYAGGTSYAMFYSPSNYGDVTRNLTGLTIGAKYRVSLTAYRYAWNGTTMAIAGKGSVPLTNGSGPTTTNLEFIATSTTHTFVLNTVANQEPGISRFVVTRLPANYAFTLTRTDANGTSAVRLQDGQDLVGGVLLATDYEAALSGPITYTATLTPSEFASTTTALNMDIGLGRSLYIMSVPVYPMYTEWVVLVTGWDMNRETTSTIHNVINRPDPIATLGRLRLRRGTLEITVGDYSDATRLASLYDRGEVVLLRQTHLLGADLYHVLSGQVSITPGDLRTWNVSVDYTEVSRPTAPLAGGSGWTYERSAEFNTTYLASSLEFATYADLFIGPS